MTTLLLPGLSRLDFWTLSGMIFALLGTLYLGLLPALLAGLLVYQLVEFGARMLSPLGVIPTTGKIILLILVSLIAITGIAFLMIGIISQVADGPESLVALLQRMADVVEAGRTYMPQWMIQYLPTNTEDWQTTFSGWLRDNASYFGAIGQDTGLLLLHVVIGMVIGGMIALNPGFQTINGPLGEALSDRVEFLNRAFRNIVFSQIRISALNTFLTAIFLLVVLPLTGNPLPLTKTMIAVTFFAGLLPIIGNLISNTVIFLIGLSVSPLTAVGTLLYLIVIHKLEYFFNARIIGGQIKARAWELLISMIVMEAAFGIAGLVAAPIYYAYLKAELTAKKLI